MLAILAITSPIYITIALGFWLTRAGLFAKVDMRVFGKFIITLALPALVFRALSQRRFDEIFNPGYLLVYLLGSLLVLCLGYLWSRRVGGLDRTSSACRAMGMAASNSGFVGYPILLLALPSVAGVVLALNMIVENLFILPLLLFLAERGRGQHRGRQIVLHALRRLATSPLIIALLAGMAVSLFAVPLPAPLTQTVNLFANASGALSLFVIGGTLAGLPLRGMGAQVWPVVIGKLVAHPLLVLLALALPPLFGLAGIGQPMRTAAVLMAAMPMMSIYPTLAQAYGQEDVSAAALLVTTVASFFTLSALLWLVQHVPRAA